MTSWHYLRFEILIVQFLYGAGDKGVLHEAKRRWKNCGSYGFARAQGLYPPLSSSNTLAFHAEELRAGSN